MSSQDSLGDRMKGYEDACRSVLPGRFPAILRIDGKAFHTYTKGCARPFSEPLIDAMNATAIALCSEIQGAQIAYVQSDEISILVHNYKSHDSQPWFRNAIQKMVSVSAGVASAKMTVESIGVFGKMKLATFDSRVFIVPESDVCNYFLWRQQDASRNSVQMVARTMFSDKECHRKSNSMLQEMMWGKGVNWNDLPTHHKRGRCISKTKFERAGGVRSKWVVDNEIPVFSQDRNYIEKFLQVELEETDKKKIVEEINL